MIIGFDENGEIREVEHNTDIPIFPYNLNLEEKRQHYKDIGLTMYRINDEMGGKIFDYKVIKSKNGIVKLERK